MTTFYFTQKNDIISVHIKSDASVNAWQGEVNFSGATPKNILVQGGITSFWQETPTINGGSIRFSGGTPNGFQGDGVLFEVIRSAGGGKISFSSDTSAYLNDGTGKEALKTLNSLTLAPIGEAQNYTDVSLPLPFLPKILSIKGVFDDRPVVVFDTTDKESGISHYEIKEFTNQGALDWHTAQSPYLINPGVNKLEIRAVDNFGNVRVETLWVSVPPLLWILWGIIFAVSLIVYNYRKRWSKQNR